MDQIDTLMAKRLLKSKNPPSTQKAKGVWYLVNNNEFENILRPDNVYLYKVHPLDKLHEIGKHSGVKQAKLDDCPGCTDNCTYCHDGVPARFIFDSAFGRPCPKTPRHGFVESIPVSSMEDVRSLMQAALAADPEAEVLVMPKLEAKCSAVWAMSSGLLVIGPSNNGATAGKDSISLHVHGQTPHNGLKIGCGISLNPSADAYIELVSENDTPIAVQAREGPVLPHATEYIPHKLTVKHVIQPSDDLLAWESLTKALHDMEGLVAWQPGGSLASHAAIHCSANNIPFLTRKEQPVVGHVLKPSNKESLEFDAKEFTLGVDLAAREAGSIYISTQLKTAIAILHNCIPLEQDSKTYSRLMGFAFTTIFRATAIACLGEASHYGHHKKGSWLLGNSSEIRAKANNLLNDTLCEELAKFSYKFLSSSWSKNFGGRPWFTAVVYAIKLWNLITQIEVQKAKEVSNIILNMAHNTGWLLNKFMGRETFDLIAEKPAEFMASNIQTLYTVLTYENYEAYALVQPRKERLSNKWKISLEPENINGNIQFTLIIGGMKCRKMFDCTETRQLLFDMLENI